MRSSLLHPGDQSGPQLPRLKCAFHCEELLTNFCSSKQCLLPLCPSCIRIHINEHVNMKTTPQLQNINDSIRDLHQQLQSYSQKFNYVYRHLVEAESGVEQFRQKLRAKVHAVKNDLLTTIQDHFKRIELMAMQKVNELKYVKNLIKFKDIAKKGILSLKNSERNFFAEEGKIMRMMIKFQSNGLRAQLDKFCAESDHFMAHSNTQSLSFNLKDHSSQLCFDSLNAIFKIDLSEPVFNNEPKDITPMIRQLYEKPAEKKEMRKSLYKFISSKNTPARTKTQQQNLKNYQSIQPSSIKDFAQSISSNKALSTSQARPELQEIEQNQHFQFVSPAHQTIDKETINYNSVKESIVKATKDFNQTVYRNSRLDEPSDVFKSKRRSLSKGRGITLINSAVGDGKTAHCNSFLKADLNLNLGLINSKTDYIPRKFR